jgi:ribonuclease HI
MAEAYALLEGLQLIERVGCSPVTVETNSLELVQAFNGTTERYGALIQLY